MVTRAKHILGIIMFLCLVFVGVSGYVIYRGLFNPPPPAEINEELKRASFVGVYICLPLKDTNAVPTAECAIGMRTDEGTYYALDFGLMEQTVPMLTDGERFSASGVITPLSYLSTDQWQKYPIVGIFSVTDSFVRRDVPEVASTTDEVSVVEHPLLSSKWIWTHTTYQGGKRITAPADELFVLSFEAESRMTSTTDCNSIGGNYVRDGEVLSFGPFFATLMACEDALEGQYTNDLALTSAYVIEGDILRLHLNRDYGTMYFKAKGATSTSERSIEVE